jgi:Bifunctional DNA primase/polymerase, N-terminal
MTPREWAQTYFARSWSSIPVSYRSKRPTLAAWPTLRLTAAELAQHFNGQPLNIGVLLGEPSGGLIDIDLDCPEALLLAGRFLPITHSCFGRTSKRRSHWLYYADPLVPTEKFEDTTGDKTAMLVELRSSGTQTVFPGSVHESGEPITWDDDGEVVRKSGADLRQAVGRLAGACLLARHWPSTGARHDTSLAVAGLLARGGLDEVQCIRIVEAAAIGAGDEQAKERRRDVMSTVARIAAGEPVTGGPTLAELLRGDGAKVVTLCDGGSDFRASTAGMTKPCASPTRAMPRDSSGTTASSCVTATRGAAGSSTTARAGGATRATSSCAGPRRPSEPSTSKLPRVAMRLSAKRSPVGDLFQQRTGDPADAHARSSRARDQA